MALDLQPVLDLAPVDDNKLDLQPVGFESPSLRAQILSPGETVPIQTGSTQEIPQAFPAREQALYDLRRTHPVAQPEGPTPEQQQAMLTGVAQPESEIQPIGEPGTLLRGASSVVAGILNRPEYLAAMANPATALAVGSAFAPQVAQQFLEDLGKASQGDNEALGRAAVIGIPALIGGVKAGRTVAERVSAKAALETAQKASSASHIDSLARAELQPGPLKAQVPVDALATLPGAVETFKRLVEEQPKEPNASSQQNSKVDVRSVLRSGESGAPEAGLPENSVAETPGVRGDQSTGPTGVQAQEEVAPDTLPPESSAGTEVQAGADETSAPAGQVEAPGAPNPAVTTKRPGVERPWDIIDELQSEVGTIRRKGAAKPGSEGYYTPEFHDLSKSGASRKLFGPEGASPDEALSAMIDKGMLGKDATVDDLRLAIEGANAQRRAIFRGETPEIKADKFQSALQKQGAKKSSQSISVGDLSVGDKFRIGGEDLEVTSIDPNTGEVQVKDGRKFGYQTIPDGADIPIEKGSLVQKAPSTEFLPEVAAEETPKLRPGEKGTAELFQGEDQPFNLAGESATDFERVAKEKTAAEKIKAEAKALEEKQQPGLVGMGGAVPNEFGESVNVVSNMKAIINQDRAARGESPMPETEPRTWSEDRVIAEGRMKGNPDYVPGLVRELLNRPRPLTSSEIIAGDLQRAYWQAELSNAWRRIEEARRDGREADKIEAQLDADRFKGNLNDMDRAFGTGGGGASELGRGLNALQAGVTDDMDIVRIRLERENALGRPLRDEEIAALQRQVNEFKAAKETLAAELDKAAAQAADATAKRLVSEQRAELAEKALPPPQVMRFIGEVRKSVKAAADESRSYFKGKVLSLSPEDLYHLSRIALDNLLEVGEDFGKWTAKMAQDLGAFYEQVKPKLQELFDKAKQARYDDLEKKKVRRTPAVDKALKEPSPTAKQEKLVKAIKEAVPEGMEPGELQKYVRSIVQTVIEDGEMEHHAIFKKVGDVLREAGIDLTEDDLQRIYGGYGKSTAAPTERVPVRMAQLRGESQKFQGLKTVLDKNTPPLATGPRRVKQSDLARRTAQQIHEAMKERGIATQTTESQLAGALDARKNYRRNRIKDLRHEIATGTRTVGKKSIPLTDTELESLDREYQQLKREHAAAFPKQPLTDEQRVATELQSLNREIASQEAANKAGDVLPKEKRPKLSTPELEAKRSQLEALRAQRDELRSLNQEWQDKKQAEALERKKAGLLRQIDAKQKIVDSGTAPVAGSKASRPAHPEIELLQQQVDALNKQIDQLRNPPKSRDQIASEAAIRYANNKIAEMQGRMARGDFEPKAAPVKPVLNSAAQTARAKMAQIKLDYERAKAKDALNKRGPLEKLGDAISRWKRNAVLTYPTILGKLTAAAGEGIMFSGLEGGVARGMSRLLPKGIQEGALRYGRGTTIAIETDALSDTVTNFVKNFKDAIKTGNIELDLAYGKPEVMPSHMLDWIGNIHYALKTPLMQNEWSRSFKTIMRNEALNGVDVSNPAVMERIKNQAYRYARERLFLDDNVLVNAYNRALRSLSEPNKLTGKPSAFGKAAETALRFELPIVRIPTNIIKRAFEYQFGLAKGTVNLLHALHKGVDTLSAEEKDVIVRNMSRGTIGAALALYGWFNSENVGGYYQPGEKKPKVPYGGMSLFGVEIPRTLLHHPALEPIQFGATARHVFNKIVGKQHASPPAALGEAAWASLLGLTEETPFAGQIKREIQNSASGSKFAGELARSAIPGFAQYIAGRLDLEPGTGGIIFGSPRQRAPKTFGQTIEMGIPGLRQNVPLKPNKPTHR